MLYRQGGDPQLLTDAVENLALLDGDLGHLASATAGLEQVLEVRRTRGDRRGLASTLGRLSQLAHLEGRIASAARLIHESLALHRDVGDTRGQVDAVAYAATLAGWPLLRPLHRQTPRVPGTGTPEPGGMAPVDLLRIVRRIALDTRVVGVDVVEVAPAYDHADNTANNGHRVIWEALAGMAKRRLNGFPIGIPG